MSEPTIPVSLNSLKWSRLFADAPRDGSFRDVVLTDDKGKTIFEQKNVNAPTAWSDQAVMIATTKYFRGKPGTREREHSVFHLIARVASTIANSGHKQGYFDGDVSRENFKADLTYLLTTQTAAFNSPVWFNVGVDSHPQTSACFILHVDDNMDSILNNAVIEGTLFKHGSGVGTNMSALRGSQELLSSGGKASGPVSFMRGYDAFAGVIKSGGKTRRAAIMRQLDVDHPDIDEFIWCKAKEEKKAAVLKQHGYGGTFNESLDLVAFQNANNSVRVTDAFMHAAQDEEGVWQLTARSDKRVTETRFARHILRDVAEAAHACGDPGLQFHDTINRWHTCPEDGEIVACNPCGEYQFLDNTSCNLASLNLVKFLAPGRFDEDMMIRAVETIITAQDILIDMSSYPSKEIEAGARGYRTLGLGYANLGALLMRCGLPYDSVEGRSLAAFVTSLMTAAAYRQSAELAEVRGPFEAFSRNKARMVDVLRRHASANHGTANDLWRDAIVKAQSTGLRNAQVTVLAPTGTIGFLMDCDTTGIEPDISLVKTKRLAGGGTMHYTNQSVKPALVRLGYSQEQCSEIMDYLLNTGRIEDCQALRRQDVPVFDCAFRAPGGTRSISVQGHLAMMSAVQPFLSGAISKTVNMPNDATVDDVMEAYVAAWKNGLKAVAIYRDGSKVVQPLETSKKESVVIKADAVQVVAKAEAVRRRLPATRQSITHKFSIAGHDGYVTVGLFEDGAPGELFLTMSKAGSTVNGFCDALGIVTSHALQYGVPLRDLVEKLSHVRFDPAGVTKNSDIRFAKSIVDYVFRWMGKQFGGSDIASVPHVEALVAATEQSDAPPCSTCGSIMVRAGSCYRCPNCGDTSGCS